MAKVMILNQKQTEKNATPYCMRKKAHIKEIDIEAIPNDL